MINTIGQTTVGYLLISGLLLNAFLGLRVIVAVVKQIIK